MTTAGTTTNYISTTFPVMTKASIVQRLLDEKLITAEEAVVLLMSDAPVAPVNPMQPYYPSPYIPGNPWNPFVTYCSNTTK
jgi:hypothetical protein